MNFQKFLSDSRLSISRLPWGYSVNKVCKKICICREVKESALGLSHMALPSSSHTDLIASRTQRLHFLVMKEEQVRRHKALSSQKGIPSKTCPHKMRTDQMVEQTQHPLLQSPCNMVQDGTGKEAILALRGDTCVGKLTQARAQLKHEHESIKTL